MKDLEILPMGDEVRADLIRNGQRWETQKRACYKCARFSSNMPLQGRCELLPNHLIVSADMSLGDTCRKFELRADARKNEGS